MGDTQPVSRYRETSWYREAPGPVPLDEVMRDVEQQVNDGNVARFQPLELGFSPLDEVLNGGMRPGELMVIGGPYGVGKTILGLQIARNVAKNDKGTCALYVCYEHDRTHLLSRLLCLESAERVRGEDALTLRYLAKLAFRPGDTVGLISKLRQDYRYADLIESIEAYSKRLVLAKASGVYSSLHEIRQWMNDLMSSDYQRFLLVIDYLQKIPVDRELLRTEEEVTTHLTHNLKELALSRGIQVIAIAAADRLGLQAKRMRLSHLRGSSAIQYETDIGIVLNNKHDIVSREHMIYNLSQAEEMRNWVVMSVEKNRAGAHAVDMEYTLDGAHFRILPEGRFVRERLIDEKVIRE